MIVSQIIGGLGNQLFQYSAGRALALRLGENYVIDTSSFKNYSFHNGFELANLFNVNIQEASKSELINLLGYRSVSPLKKILIHPRSKIIACKPFVFEPSLSYWSGFEHINDDSYLIGNWQSEKYFKSIEAVIREDLKFKPLLSFINKKIIDDMSKSDSIAIHVRRGDYAKSKKALNIHGLCSIQYYEFAILMMIEKLKNPKFFIFSDDIEWVKANLNIKYPHVFISHNTGNASFNDMRLMASCQHNIIANSSFSWWGAWLNPNQKKIVIAPAKWFANPLWVNNDIIPSEWHSI